MYITWPQAISFYASKGGRDKTLTDRQDTLPTDKKRFFDKLFHGKFRSAIGMRALWMVDLSLQVRLQSQYCRLLILVPACLFTTTG